MVVPYQAVTEVRIGVLRDLEPADDVDLAAAHRAAAEAGTNVPHEQVLAELAEDEARARRNA